MLGAPTWTAVVLALLLPYLIMARVRGYRSGQRRIGRLLLMLAVGALLLAALVTFRLWWVAALFGAGLTACFMIARLGHAAQRGARRAITTLGTVTFVTILIFAAFADEVWVPRERITVGNEQVVGYVMENKGQFLTVLTDRPRKIRILPSREVTARTDASD